jgi:hypothetical protein
VFVPPTVDPRLSDASSLARLLESEGLPAVLKRLNSRTSFRFTGLYRFDGDVLRNVALHDRWNPDQLHGADAPLGQTYCAITGRLNDVLLVSDGPRDRRYPWMHGNSMVSYCGVPIRSEFGYALGTLCHFDEQPCDATAEEATFLLCIAEHFRHYLA